MGLRSATYICQRVTDAVRFMCTLLSIAVVNYLDDFAGADKPELVFIGVYFYTEDLTLSVTPERVRETLDLTDLWLYKDSALLQELQSLIGKLSFIVSCVHSSRVFICRLLNWLREIHSCVLAQPIPNLIHKDKCYGGKPSYLSTMGSYDAVGGLVRARRKFCLRCLSYRVRGNNAVFIFP